MFIKLTWLIGPSNNRTEAPVYVNINTICYIRKIDDKPTAILFIRGIHGERLWVKENPQEIIDMINSACKAG